MVEPPKAQLSPEEACAEAVRLAGGTGAVAAHFMISGQAVRKWKVVPQHRCLALAVLIGHKVTVQEMRPDVFGQEPAELRAAAAAAPSI